MKKVLLPILTIGLMNLTPGQKAHAFTENKLKKPFLTFDGELVVPKGLTKSEIEKKILEQTGHLLGTFHSKSFIKNLGRKAL